MSIIKNLTISEIEHLYEAMEKEAYRKDTIINTLEARIEELENQLKDSNRIKELYRGNILSEQKRINQQIRSIQEHLKEGIICRNIDIKV